MRASLPGIECANNGPHERRLGGVHKRWVVQVCQRSSGQGKRAVRAPVLRLGAVGDSRLRLFPVPQNALRLTSTACHTPAYFAPITLLLTLPMSGDVVINMPSEPRRPVTAFDLDPSTPSDASRKRQRRGIVQLTVDVPSSYRPATNAEEIKSRPRWLTLEFLLYYMVAVVVIPLMVWVPMRLSTRASR